MLISTTAFVNGLPQIKDASAAKPAIQGDVADFSQCANGDSTHFPIATDCAEGWINGILNANNNHYGEDQVVAQRLVLSYPDGSELTGKTITLSHQARKGSSDTHTYDSMGTWNLTVLTADRCEGLAAGICPLTGASTFAIPDDPTLVVPAGPGGIPSLTTITTPHMIPAGVGRVATMYGGTLTAVSTASHDDPSGTSDDYATTTFTFSVPASGSTRYVELLVGGHTAQGTGVVRGWGTDLGSSSTSGGPYHFKLINIDGKSIGNRDNQIQGAAIDVCAGVNCDDSNACTSDSCNPDSGQCEHTAPPSCDDQNACTGDSCNITTGLCEHTAPPSCDDSNTCTNDVCDPNTGLCVNTDNGSCNLEACSPGFWKNHLPPSSAWPNSGYVPGQTLTSAGFVNPSSNAISMSDSMINALSYQGGPGLAGGERILVRACVSALLSASNSNIAYPFTPTEILDACNTALANNNRAADTALAGTYNGLYDTLVCSINGKEPLS